MKTPHILLLHSAILLMAISAIIGLGSCQGNSFKGASDYDPKLDSTYVYSLDSLLLYRPYTLGDSLNLPALSNFENAILVHGYSWWKQLDYRCIIVGEETKKIQLIYKDIHHADTIEHYKYHERILTAKEYDGIVDFILDRDIVSLPMDMEHGKRYTDSDFYVVSVKEKGFMKSTCWQIYDIDNREKRKATYVLKEVLRLANYPPPVPYVKLKTKNNFSFKFWLGVSDPSLIVDYEVKYDGEKLVYQDSVGYPDVYVPIQEVSKLKDRLKFTGLLANGEKIVLDGLVVDSSKVRIETHDY